MSAPGMFPDKVCVECERVMPFRYLYAGQVPVYTDDSLPDYIPHFEVERDLDRCISCAGGRTDVLRGTGKETA